jgi:hypothetical protein
VPKWDKVRQSETITKGIQRTSKRWATWSSKGHKPIVHSHPFAKFLSVGPISVKELENGHLMFWLMWSILYLALL